MKRHWANLHVPEQPLYCSFGLKLLAPGIQIYWRSQSKWPEHGAQSPKVVREEGYSLLQQAGAGHGCKLWFCGCPHTFHLCKLLVSQDDTYIRLCPGSSSDVATHLKCRAGEGPEISVVQPWRCASGLENSLRSVLHCGVDVATAITFPQFL